MRAAGSPVGPDTGVHAPGSSPCQCTAARRAVPAGLTRTRTGPPPHRKRCCGFREIRTETGVKGYEAYTAVILTSLGWASHPDPVAAVQMPRSKPAERSCRRWGWASLGSSNGAATSVAGGLCIERSLSSRVIRRVTSGASNTR